MPTEILMLGMLRALIEVAGLMLILRGVLWVFGLKARQGNFVYDILTIGAMPFVKLTRAVDLLRYARRRDGPIVASGGRRRLSSATARGASGTCRRERGCRRSPAGPRTGALPSPVFHIDLVSAHRAANAGRRNRNSAVVR